MPTNVRKSEYYKGRRGRRGHPEWTPNLEEWIEACGDSPYNSHIIKQFEISYETFHNFLDREHYKQEQDPSYKSKYIEALKKERSITRKLTKFAFRKAISKGEIGAIIFSMKTFSGVIEPKDLKMLDLKRKEFDLRSKEYLTNLAQKFNLNFDELKSFADQYFKNVDLDKS